MSVKKIAIAIIFLAFLFASYWAWPAFFPAEEGVIQVSGTIEATTVNLTAKLAGTIESCTIEPSDSVKKGQLIAALTRNDLLAQRERDQLTVTKAEASLADLESGARVQEISEAEANLNIAVANLQSAEADLDRLKPLYDQGGIAKADYENAQFNLEINRNRVQAAEARAGLLKTGTREEMITAAKIEIERNRAILKATDAMLEDLEIYSPLDGVVLSKYYEMGEFVTPGASLATIANLDDLWIKVYIPTDDLPQIRLKQQVSFTVSGFPEVFTGVVEEIATKGEFTPKTIQTKKERTNVVFAVKIKINNKDGILKPGMPADVVFPNVNAHD